MTVGRSQMSPAAAISWNHRASAESARSVPSSQLTMLSYSCDSNHPPGCRFSNACLAICSSNEAQQPEVTRVWM